MAKNKTIVVDGECEACGFPGVIGMTCSECGGQIISFSDPASPAKETDRYSADDMSAADDGTVSLEELAENEDNDYATVDDEM